MSKNLVIVESPAKAKTIQKYLGKDFDVIASYGHVRDLLPKTGSVIPENDFEMKYQLIERNAKHVDNIAKRLKKSEALYLATDPDREGEAISWHVLEEMHARKLIKDKPIYRIFFNEITKSAVKDALNNPRDIAMDLVNAQQARRALDYLVGFNLSPLLWKKIRRGLSAGRVQSPALRLIVERELEIEAFEVQEYWSIIANCQSDSDKFIAKLIAFNHTQLKQFSICTESEAHQTIETVKSAANGQLQIKKIDKKKKKRNPAPPFITSTLQQEAARKLGFTTKRTMSIAQQLYEGIDIGAGNVGLITYMRTDSVHLAQDALQEIRNHIKMHYGNDNLPDKPRAFKTKSKNAQEAHEAIRPTDIHNKPSDIKAYLSQEQFKLYELIWKRTIASQMAEALINSVSITLEATPAHLFKATGSTIAKPGFLSVYQEGKDDKKEVDEDKETLLPKLEEGQWVTLSELTPQQHFTTPPPRYSEASLVKALEDYDIGRPSTYASIIHTLQQRDYVILEKKRFKPTDVGRIVNRFLTEYFTQYVDYQFTAQLEDTLDAIARGEQSLVPVLEAFWGPFHHKIEDIDKSVKRQDVTTEEIDEHCPKCDAKLAIRLGKRGRFIGCTAYPDCDYTANIGESGEEEAKPEVVADRACPECTHPLHIKTGRYGKFIGCSNYPACKHMEPLDKPKDTGVSCPKCNQGNIYERKSRRGKIFFSCNRYPDCDYALWNKPIEEPCPKCKSPILTLKETKARGKEKVCPEAKCKYTTPYEEI